MSQLFSIMHPSQKCKLSFPTGRGRKNGGLSLDISSLLLPVLGILLLLARRPENIELEPVDLALLVRDTA